MCISNIIDKFTCDSYLAAVDKLSELDEQKESTLLKQSLSAEAYVIKICVIMG